MDTVTTILSVPAVLAIVQLLKSFGVAGKWALLAAVIVAVALNVADYLWATSGLYGSVVSGLLLGLAAAGLYDAARAAAPKAGVGRGRPGSGTAPDPGLILVPQAALSVSPVSAPSWRASILRMTSARGR